MPKLPKDKVPYWVGSDPIIGRLACPPFSRLNLKTRHSEGLFFKHVQALENSGKTSWTYDLRNGIYWWSGQEVSSKDVKEFFEKNIDRVHAEKSLGTWPLPAYEVSMAEDKITIHWAAKPVFGPYFLNGIPFARSHSGQELGYECAGTYVLQGSEGDDYYLKASPRYGVSEHSTLTVSPKAVPTSDLVFNAAGEQQHLDCKQKVSLPWISGIAWNPKEVPVAIRPLLTMALPRGALLRQAGGYLGELSTSLIPRAHPGYDNSLSLRRFDLEFAEQSLEHSGFGAKLEHSAVKKGRAVFYIESPLKESILHKVIEDCFFTLNILVNFVAPGSVPKESLHGRLVSFILDGPDLNLLAELHSKAAGNVLWPMIGGELDQALERQALASTQAAPDFTASTDLHKMLYKLEPVSVFFQHDTCVQSKKALDFAKVKTSDPDWFRTLVKTI